MIRYCEACDRVNRKRSAFCGSCGQPLALVGTHIEKFSFPIWAVMAALCFLLLPTTLLFVALGYTYWAVHAYEVLTAETSKAMTAVIVVTLLFYASFYFFILYEFGHRQSVRIFSYIHVACSVIGAAFSTYFAFLATRAVAGIASAPHEALQHATTEQLVSVAYFVLTHYVLFALFYFALLFFSVRMLRMKRQKAMSPAMRTEQ